MAENLDDGEFWLPPQFLADEDATDLPFELNRPPLRFNNGDDPLMFPSEFPRGLGFPSSDLSSPVESLGGGSSETESDEEEQQLVAELTRRMARSSLHVDFKSSESSMGRFVSGSPQSTLCGFRKDSSQGSPTSVCKKSSSRATWDLLHAAAGEVERMRLSQEAHHGSGHHNHDGLLAPQRNPSPVVTLSSNNTNTSTNPDVGFHTNQSLSYQQLLMAQFQLMRQQQMAAKRQNSVWGAQKQDGGVHQQRQNNHMATNRGRNSDVSGVNGRNTRPLGLATSAWPPLRQVKQQQQQNQHCGSGMRAVFLSNPSGRSKCAGTGVFLPRRVDSPAESRKKPAYSTVLVPTRAAQALNLKLDDMVGGQPQQHLHLFSVCSDLENAAAPPRLRSNYVHSQLMRPQPPVNHQEIILPQEWTY